MAGTDLAHAPGAPIDEPIHATIYRYLVTLIEAGEASEGSRLPSEAELQARFLVSRTPVRQALKRLQSTGAIVRAQGRGSYVASTKIGAALRDMAGFGEELRRLGHTVQPRTLDVTVAVPPAEVRSALRMADGDMTCLVVRLFIVDGEPLGVFHHWLTPRLSSAAVRGAGDFVSLTELAKRLGVQPYRGTEFVGAATATPEQAELLGCPAGAALLTMRRVSADIDRLPVEYTTYFVRADRYEYQVNLIGHR